MKVLLSENITDFDLDAALANISEQRREQALRFKFDQGRRLCVLAYLLLKQGLRELYGITDNPIFEYNEHGKPAIIGHPEIFFNLSHCKEAVVCAISNRPIGIDVESIREYKECLVHYTMNEAEIKEIEAASNPAAAFIRLWTMKEAALKLIGTGISDNLKTVLTCHSELHYSTHTTPHYIYTVCHE